MELSIRNLSKTYANGVRALNDVSLEIPKGMFGLLGPNGAGKSTLMRTIATLQDPDSGSVQLDGLDVLANKAEARRQLVEFISSDAVFHGDFTLTSGKKASYYVDLRKVSLDHRVAPLIGQVMLDLIAEVATTDKIIVEKSTIPVRTAEAIKEILAANSRGGLTLVTARTSTLGQNPSCTKREDEMTGIGRKGRRAALVGLAVFAAIAIWLPDDTKGRRVGRGAAMSYPSLATPPTGASVVAATAPARQRLKKRPTIWSCSSDAGSPTARHELSRRRNRPAGERSLRSLQAPSASVSRSVESASVCASRPARRRASSSKRSTPSAM